MKIIVEAYRRHPARFTLLAIEIAAALLIPLFIVSKTALRRLFGSIALAGLYGLTSLWQLLEIDAPGTLRSLGRGLLILALLVGPAVWALARSPRHRWTWAPLILAFLLFFGPMALAGISTPTMWSILAGLSTIGFVSAAFGIKRILVILPLFAALEPMVGHFKLGLLYWSHDRIVNRCEDAPGTRPKGWEDIAGLAWFAVTPLSADQMLVTGERRSHWIERDEAGALVVDPVRRDSGNFWGGCTRGNTVWVTNLRGLFGFSKDRETTQHFLVPHSDGDRIELDLLDVRCTEDGSFWISEFVNAGVWQRDPEGVFNRIPAGNFYTQLDHSPDGGLVVLDSTTVRNLEPTTGQLGPATTVASVGLGFAVCPRDGAVAVADLLGRLREFTPEGEHYSFRRGIDLPAPRRVAYSPDCTWIAATSADDKTVTVLKRSDLSIVRKLSMGPSLRDIEFLDGKSLAVVDACSLNVISLD